MTQIADDRLAESGVVAKLRSAYYHLQLAKPNGATVHERATATQGLLLLADRIESKQPDIKFRQLYVFNERLYHQAVEILEKATRHGYRF